MDAMDYYRNNYFSDRLIVAMEGDIDPARALDRAQECFVLPRGLARSYTTFPFTPSVVERKSKDLPATKATLLFKSMDSSADSYKVHLEMMAQYALMATRGPIYSCVREIEKPLAYSVIPGHTALAAFKANLFEFTAYPKNVGPVIEGIAKAIKGFVENPDREAIERMQVSGLKAAIDAIKRQPEIGPSGMVGDIFYRGVIDARDVYVDYYKRATCEEIVEAAKETFLNGAVSAVYRGTVSKKYPDTEKLCELFKLDIPSTSVAQGYTPAPK